LFVTQGTYWVPKAAEFYLEFKNVNTWNVLTCLAVPNYTGYFTPFSEINA
jgi:hypothetical protein